MNKRKTLTLVLTLAFVVVLAGVFYFLNSKFHFFADVVAFPECDTAHPYVLKTGKQAYMNGTTQVENPGAPGLPANYLVRITGQDAKAELGYYPSSNNVVCWKKNNVFGQVPSYVDPSGEILFQVQDDIPQDTEVEYYISKTADATKRLDLVAAKDIETHPFANEKAFDGAKTGTFWGKVLWGATADFVLTSDKSPGGTDTLLLKNINKQSDQKWSTALNSTAFQYDPAINQDLKGTYFLITGWSKFANIKVSQDANAVPLDNKFGARTMSDIYRNGEWKGARRLAVDSDVNSDWERYFEPVILGSDKISFAANSHTANISAGEIYYSSFQTIKNIKAPRDIANWSNNSLAYFKKPFINPHASVSFPGTAFQVDSATKLYMTNGSADYYKDHFDGTDLVVTAQMQKTLADKYSVNISRAEIKDFKGDKSIIIGDLSNSAFKDFAYKLMPDLVKKNIRAEGYRLYVGEKYILAVGSDMTGSYYGSLRLAELFSRSEPISQRIEEDYPDSAFRSIFSWDVTQHEKDPTKIEADIKRLSGLRYNIYAINGPFEYANLDTNEAQKNLLIELFGYARKYFVEPVASSFSFGFSYGANIRSMFYNTRSVSFPASDKTKKFATYLVRKFTDDARTASMDQANLPDIPLTVQNFDKSVTYKEGTDYQINSAVGNNTITISDNSTIKPTEYDLTLVMPSAADKNVKFQVGKTSGILAAKPLEVWDSKKTTKYNENSDYTVAGSGSAFTISIPDASAIKPANYTINMTYNGENGEGKSSRIQSSSARGIVAKGIENAINYLHPKYIHINNDELAGVGQDYRDIYNPDGTKTNKTPADLYAELINFEYNKIKSLSPTTEVIMWSDMINPYHRYQWNYNNNQKPYTFAAVDNIPKDIILDEWYITLGNSINCQQLNNSVNYHLQKGFRIIAGATTESDPNIFRCFDQIAKNNPAKFVGYNIPQWEEQKDDKPSAQLHADQIWNASTTEILSGPKPVWFDGSPVFESINITEGQVITANPYVITAMVSSVFGISKVEFYVDNNLIGTSTLPDVSGAYEATWDTSKYQSAVKIIAYDTAGNKTEALLGTTVQLAGAPNSGGSVNLTDPVFGILPKTGQDDWSSSLKDNVRRVLNISY